MKMSVDETRNDLLADLGVENAAPLPSLDQMIAGETRFVRDLRVNLSGVLESENLSPKEAFLVALAVAVNEKNDILIQAFDRKARAAGASEAEVAETHACASLLATNNVLYRFRHFISKSTDAYQTMPARIKMNIMARPVLGKEFFELMSLAVSAVNGCEMCVQAHEASVRGLGCPQVRVFDAVRLAAVVRGASLVLR